MKTQQATYLEFLGTPGTQMAIPVFQRVYTWGVWQCAELLEDVLNAGRDDDSHFIGSIVYTQENIDRDGGVAQLFNIVDGQQRTTTMTLLLIALRDYLVKHGGTAGGKTAEDIEREYLFIQGPAGRIQKFIAAPADKDTLAAVLNGTEMPVSYMLSKCVVDNYAYFEDQLKTADKDILWRGLMSLFAIVVELGGDDNPQLIFEGINSKGMSLATSDLLRNRMFFGHDEATQERLLSTYWEPLEDLFKDDPNQNHFNAALRRWLVEQDKSLEKHSRYELYSVFRKYIDERYQGTTEDLMKELLASCEEFSHMIKSPPMKKHLDWAEGHTKVDTGSGHALFG